ncbi:hypothetical protein LOC67_11825 [Stieleria sp. JC731]|uniref:hypothetical protein n=1 Tax=Pirellulaceae TaxID=2691357 RepID=UPI001E57EA10|nr:hypothetical protein [Stieleria sp. JC731]MCC9601236.1 hypothetical protein [Stieleria sp. JC731]
MNYCVEIPAAVAKTNTTCLFAASVPGSDGVDAILLDEMLRAAGLDSIVLAAVVNERRFSAAKLETFKSAISISPPNEWYTDQPHSPYSFPKRFARHRWPYAKQVNRCVEKAKALLKSEQPEQLWIILNSIAMIDAATEISKLYPGPIVTQVWDDVVHLCNQRKLDRFHRQRTQQRFAALLRRSERLGVICEEAAQAYSMHTDASIEIVRHGLCCEPTLPKLDTARTDEFRIGFAGSVYATDAWNSLQQALDSVEWRIDGRQVVLAVAGSRVNLESNSQANTIFYGWREPIELQRLLSNCDCLYLPQSFASSDANLTRLSFPTKLSSYVSTGRPILVHSPTYGSVHRFCKEHALGTFCATLAPDDLISCLMKLAISRDYYRAQAHASSRIANNVLTHQAFKQSVRRMLGSEAAS